MSQATTTISLTIEQLNATALRLRERSDEIHQLSLQDLRRDLIMAARCADLLAHVKFALGELADKIAMREVVYTTIEHDIRALLDAAECSDPKIGEA